MFVDKKNSPSLPITRFLSVFSSQNFLQCLLDMVFLPKSPSMYSIRLVFPTQGFYQCHPFHISNGIPLTGFSALSLPHRDSSDFQQCLPGRVFVLYLSHWVPPMLLQGFRQLPPFVVSISTSLPFSPGIRNAAPELTSIVPTGFLQ
jgi:hypothetical protein